MEEMSPIKVNKEESPIRLNKEELPIKPEETSPTKLD
jgi:hypothetical protein